MSKKKKKVLLIAVAAFAVASAITGAVSSEKVATSDSKEPVSASATMDNPVIKPDTTVATATPSVQETVQKYNTIDQLHEIVDSSCDGYNTRTIKILNGTLTYDVVSATAVELYYNVKNPISADNESQVEDVKEQILNRVIGDINEAELPESVDVNITVEYTIKTGTDYVLNTNTKKFHYTWCSSIDQMADKNKSYYTGTREEVIAMGYGSCGRCHP